MKIGVLSDSHDNLHNLSEAIQVLKNRGINVAFHVGDFCAPSTVMRMLENSVGIKWYCVWGNVDGDKIKTVQMVNNDNFDIGAETFRSIEIDGKNVFLSHYPDVAQLAAESGRYDAVFYGHDHLKYSHILRSGCLLANPGEIVGYKTKTASLGIWDTQNNLFEHIILENSILAV